MAFPGPKLVLRMTSDLFRCTAEVIEFNFLVGIPDLQDELGSLDNDVANWLDEAGSLDHDIERFLDNDEAQISSQPETSITTTDDVAFETYPKSK